MQGQMDSREAISAIYTALAAGNKDGLLALVDPEIVAEQASSFPFGGLWRGHEGFAKMAAALIQAWPDFSVVPRTFCADGDTVLVLTRVTGTHAGAPATLDMDMIELWRVRNGKAFECRPFYFDSATAATTCRPVRSER